MSAETPTIAYNMGEDGHAVFARVCPTCNRFVKADEVMTASIRDIQQDKKANATCAKHGRVVMPFEGFF